MEETKKKKKKKGSITFNQIKNKQNKIALHLPCKNLKTFSLSNDFFFLFHKQICV